MPIIPQDETFRMDGFEMLDMPKEPAFTAGADAVTEDHSTAFGAPKSPGLAERLAKRPRAFVLSAAAKAEHVERCRAEKAAQELAKQKKNAARRAGAKLHQQAEKAKLDIMLDRINEKSQLATRRRSDFVSEKQTKAELQNHTVENAKQRLEEKQRTLAASIARKCEAAAEKKKRMMQQKQMMAQLGRYKYFKPPATAGTAKLNDAASTNSAAAPVGFVDVHWSVSDSGAVVPNLQSGATSPRTSTNVTKAKISTLRHNIVVERQKIKEALRRLIAEEALTRRQTDATARRHVYSLSKHRVGRAILRQLHAKARVMAQESERDFTALALVHRQKLAADRRDISLYARRPSVKKNLRSLMRDAGICA